MLCALIMAGGKGERFWPLSTDEKPKQFLKLLGDTSMIQMTVQRIETLIPIERTFVVTAKNYVDLVKEQLPELPERNIIVEPVGKNTAPCIGLSAFIINKYFKDASIVVLPSDHLVRDEEEFVRTLKAASDFVEDNDDAIVTIGMKPNRPETGYGYIKFRGEASGSKILEVEKFVEKPSEDRAKEYLADGSYLWNGGMFVWKASNILRLTEKFLNKTFNILSEIAVASESEFEEVLDEKYRLIDSISVDYGIMERAENIYVIPGEFGWDDVGTWYSLERYREKDKNDNVSVGNILHINSNNNIVVSCSKPVIISGHSNIFVVESDDVIFIGTKDDIENIKDIKKLIK